MKTKLPPPQPPVSRTQLDEKLGELYNVSPRTIRLWRRKSAPLDDREEMADWIADMRRQGKGDGAEVHAARMKKLELQIEALELTNQQAADEFITRKFFLRLFEPLIDVARDALKELLLTEQPMMLTGKSEHAMREVTGKQFAAFLAKMHAFCKSDVLAQEAELKAAEEANRPPATEPEAPASDAPAKPGRVADPEMEALRLRKLNLECAALERENLMARGELLPLSECEAQYQEHFGQLRMDIRNRLKTEQPATLSGRNAEQILEINRKTYESFARRLRSIAEKLSAFKGTKATQTV
jgi:hypothetical protein